jgi:hypothetical protein
MTLRYLNLEFMSAMWAALALALLVACIGAADHVDHAAAPHDLAVLADLLDGWTYFHRTPALGAMASEG